MKYEVWNFKKAQKILKYEVWVWVWNIFFILFTKVNIYLNYNEKYFNHRFVIDIQNVITLNVMQKYAHGDYKS